MAIEVQFHESVLNEVYRPYLTDETETQIYYGGSSSGKSVFLSERLVFDLLNGGRNYLVCRQVGRTVRGSVSQEINKVINDWNMQELFSVNKTDGTITCQNGYQCIFTGLDDVEKLKSITPEKGVITDVWVEEATETEKASLIQLKKRLRGGSESVAKRITLSFNPILQTHWIYEEYFSGIEWADEQTEYRSEDLCILKTTYKDNRFLTSQDIKLLESEKDSYYYQVYTLGNWGVLGNVIFTNWSVRDLSDMRDQFVNRRNGLDFGFSADPAALSRSHYDSNHQIIYVFNDFQSSGLTNDILAQHVLEICGDDYIVCDSAEPKSVAELNQHGVSAMSAKKGKDSVIHGIQWLQQQTIVIDTSCVNAKNELMQYKWKEDKNGVAMRVPVDRNNHFIDATRYAYEDDMSSSWYFSSYD